MKTNKIFTPFKFIFIAGLLVGSSCTSYAQQEMKTLNEAQGIPVGSKVENFKAKDHIGNTVNLANSLKKGPVVILFYRGQWCPVCSKHLSQLQDSIQYIVSLGATVLAVSPEKPEYSSKMSKKTNATFSLIYDEAYKISKAFDVLFLPDENTRQIYNARLGANLSQAHSDSSEQLPIPATFVIQQNGTVVWRHFNPDYRARATVKEIVEVIKNIK
jgi:peroxiredoxin